MLPIAAVLLTLILKIRVGGSFSALRFHWLWCTNHLIEGNEGIGGSIRTVLGEYLLNRSIQEEKSPAKSKGELCIYVCACVCVHVMLFYSASCLWSICIPRVYKMQQFVLAPLSAMWQKASGLLLKYQPFRVMCLGTSGVCLYWFGKYVRQWRALRRANKLYRGETGWPYLIVHLCTTLNTELSFQTS